MKKEAKTVIMKQKNKHLVVIMFPYSGFNTNPKYFSGDKQDERKNQKNRKKNFEKLIRCCDKEGCRPLVILNKDTVNRKAPNNADEFFKTYAKNKKQDKNAETFKAKFDGISFDVRQVWSVDTCQMWLAGWGHIINNLEKKSKSLKNYRLVQIPGDLDRVGKDKKEKKEFFKKTLRKFIKAHSADIVIGDYTTGSQFSSKNIIDIYGTFPLLGNWFPNVQDYLERQKINKPKSEFLNINIKVLKKLLGYPKFAYEQTLNMIIRLGYSLEYEDIPYPAHKQIITQGEQRQAPWDKKFLLGNTHEIAKFDLGIIKDDPGFRNIQSCFDQIERTERLLKRLWRQLFSPPQTSDEKQYREFLDEYDRRIQRSDAVTETARIMIRSFRNRT